MFWENKISQLSKITSSQN